MHDNSRLVLDRVLRFVLERVEPAIYRAVSPLAVTAWEAPDEPVPFADAVGRRFAAVTPGTPWGRPWGTTWFHVTGEVPAGWRERGRVEVVCDLGFTGATPGFQAEGLVYAPDGSIVKAIEPLNAYVPVPRDEDRIDLYIEAASNPNIGGDWTFQPTPLGLKETAGGDPLYVLRRIDVALRDETVWELDRDLWTLRGLLAELPAATSRAAEILRALEHAVDAVDPHDVAGTAQAGRDALAGVLAAPASASAHRVTAVGHAHIDSAWLWPVRETIRKCARTFSNVLHLMDEDPGLVFACSSAQQYAWMQEFYPELFERIRARVAEGRFVPVGGMWVESDTNMPGGEAMVRQFLLGKAFFARELGVDPSVGWLPDSFGYTGALPQILRGAGVPYFLTQKISWNETDLFPHHTFLWEGIDGSRVLTHFPPVDTYNSTLSGADLARAERNFAEKGEANSSIVPFGYGDGGGGPTREMLAAAARTRSLEGSPIVRIASPETFFREAEAEYARPPVWSGELYLEFHRGTYTSQARTKRGNRRSEHLLREAELWATTAAVRSGTAYPYDDLERAWRTVLLHQFHDILPGSSIAWVHREAESAYARVAEELESLIAQAIARASRDGDEASGVLAHASPFAIAGVPALGAGVPVRSGSVSIERTGERIVLASDRARFVLDGTGHVVSAVDLASGREAIAPGEAAAELQLFRDTPSAWDAWDVDVHYRRHGETIAAVDAIEIVAEGPERVAVRVDRSFGASRVSSELSLEAGSATLELRIGLDWHERQRLLKLAFPLDVHAGRAASEVQFGHVERATHENTSWDAARFETSAHRWVHVGEPGFGVAIANDSTYGHDVTRIPRAGGGTATLVRQSLVRAPLFPDPEADQGRHELRSSLTVGASIGDAVREGYRINLPLRPARAPIAPLVRVSEPAVVVEAVKLAEDRSGDVVVRLYESLGARTRTAVAFDFPVARAVETDLLERELRELPGDGEARVSLELGPFQVRTVRLRRR